MRMICAIAIVASGCMQTGMDPEISWAPPAVVTWAFDSRCETPTASEADELASGIELWRQVGVQTLPAAGSQPDVWVCLTPGAPEPGYSGWQDWDESGTARASVSRAVVLDRLATIVAHEFGHVILPGSGDENHLPPGEDGILSAHASGSRWSPDDEDFLAGFGGFSPVVVAR